MVVSMRSRVISSDQAVLHRVGGLAVGWVNVYCIGHVDGTWVQVYSHINMIDPIQRKAAVLRLLLLLG